MAPHNVRVITRISAADETPEGLSGVADPAEFEEPRLKERRSVTDRSGRELLVETFVLVGKPGSVPTDCSDIPGLVPAAPLEGLGDPGEFRVSVPKVLTREKIRELLDAGGMQEEDDAALEIHIDPKKIRESREPQKSPRKVPSKGARLKPLMSYFVENECLMCGEILTRAARSRVRSHMAGHLARKGGYRCRRCGATFLAAADLYTHVLKEEEGPTEYRCDRCEETYKRKYLLTLHYQDAHSQVIPGPSGDKAGGFLLMQKIPPCFSCSVCGRNFTAWEEVSGHRHEGATQRFLCLSCGRSFPGSRLLRYHSHVRVVRKCHACRRCGTAFPTLLGLLGHQRRVHTRRREHPRARASTSGAG